jgi:hypothetical protein
MPRRPTAGGRRGDVTHAPARGSPVRVAGNNLTMRVVFAAYLALISAGIVVAFVVGLTHR